MMEGDWPGCLDERDDRESPKVFRLQVRHEAAEEDDGGPRQHQQREPPDAHRQVAHEHGVVVDGLDLRPWLIT